MTLRLVKTTGGHSGTPSKCSACGRSSFIMAGIAWHCAYCKVYFPANLSTQSSASRLKANFKELVKLHGELRVMLSELEDLVKK